MGLVLWAWLAGADHQDSGDQATAAEATIDEALTKLWAIEYDCPE